MRKSERKKDDITFFKIITKTFPIAYSAASEFFIFWLVISILHGVSYGMNTLMLARLFDSVNIAVTTKSGITAPVIAAVLLGLTLIGIQVLHGVQNFMNNSFFQIVDGHINSIKNTKVGKIDPIVFEDPEFLDDINKAGKGVENSLNFILIFTTLITFYLPYFIFMGIYLFLLKPILAFSIVIIFIPSMINKLIQTKIFSKLEDTSAPIRREMDNYQDCICSRELYKETRLLGAYNFFNKLLSETITLLSKETWKAERKTGLLELLMKVITLIGYSGVLLLLVDALLKKEITVGSFSAVFTSVGTMFGLMDGIINYHIGRITKNVGTVKNIIRFLELPEREGTEKEFGLENGVTLENVSFIYPKSEKPSIKNISVAIKPKETVAVIGMNGAGKSTLIKLITGLYAPSEGSVKFGGVETKDISSSMIYSDISAVFQNYGKYKITLSENITISDLNNGDLDIETPAKNADVEINSETFPNGMETMLSKEFDGVDISGGQWQRVAIARGLYKKHKLVVLDEPTSAIDPIEETKLYKKFAEISKDVISIIVTHRLGSARIADRIIVMDNGEIVEIGSHESLLANKGKYAELWEAQAQYYVSESK